MNNYSFTIEPIKRKFEKSGMSLRKVAAECGVSHTSIDRWMNSTVAPNVDGLLSLCALFNVSPRSLFQVNKDDGRLHEASE